MKKSRINSLSIFVWFFSSIFLLLVQFGFISPFGFIVVTLIQFVWLFWLSVFMFIFTTINLIARVRRHARWTTGFTGEIVRTVRIAGQEREYFIRGKSDATIRDVLLDVWPFNELDVDTKWYVADSQGNDITNESFGSIDGTVSIIIENDSK